MCLSNLKLPQLGILGGSVWPSVTSDARPPLHLLQPLGQVQEPLAHLPESGQCRAQLVLSLAQTVPVGPPLPLSSVQGSVFDLRDTPGDNSLPAAQHRGEQRMALGAVLLQELQEKRKEWEKKRHELKLTSLQLYKRSSVPHLDKKKTSTLSKQNIGSACSVNGENVDEVLETGWKCYS